MVGPNVGTISISLSSLKCFAVADHRRKAALISVWEREKIWRRSSEYGGVGEARGTPWQRRIASTTASDWCLEYFVLVLSLGSSSRYRTLFTARPLTITTTIKAGYSFRVQSNSIGDSATIPAPASSRAAVLLRYGTLYCPPVPGAVAISGVRRFTAMSARGRALGTWRGTRARPAGFTVLIQPGCCLASAPVLRRSIGWTQIMRLSR